MRRDNTKILVKIIFWSHFLVAVLSHIAVLAMIAGAINMLINSEGMSIWTKGMMFGLLFYSGMYAINHVTNDEGFCVLTDIENIYRKKCGMPLIGKFTPRFYKQCSLIWRGIIRKQM